MNKRFLSLVLFVVLAMIVIVAVVIRGTHDRSVRPASPPLAQGRQVYQVWTSGTGPNISEVAIDPFDPSFGERQTMSVAVAYETPIDAVRVLLSTDSRETVHVLTPMNGRWEGSWNADDTHQVRYHATVHVVAGAATSSVTLTFR